MKLYLSSYKLGNDIELLKEWVKNNNKMLVIVWLPKWDKITNISISQSALKRNEC